MVSTYPCIRLCEGYNLQWKMEGRQSSFCGPTRKYTRILYQVSDSKRVQRGAQRHNFHKEHDGPRRLHHGPTPSTHGPFDALSRMNITINVISNDMVHECDEKSPRNSDIQDEKGAANPSTKSQAQ